MEVGKFLCVTRCSYRSAPAYSASDGQALQHFIMRMGCREEKASLSPTRASKMLDVGVR